jgi:signal transduction histidine kinase
MNYLLLNFIIALWIETVASLFFGIFLLVKGKEKSHKLFGLHSLSVFWWSFCQIWEIACDKHSTALFWGRIEMVGVIFIATFFFHFTISFLGIKNKKWIIRFAYLANLVFIILSPTKYMTIDVVPKFYVKYYQVPGLALHFLTGIFCICVSYSLWKIFEAYRNSSGERRNQLKYLWLSMLLGFSGGSANFLLGYGVDITILPFLTYMGGFWVGVATYAIIRHHLLDINIVIKKTAVYSILVTLITITYFVTVYIMESLFRDFVGYKSIPWTLSVIALFILIFQPLKNLVQSFVDKYFFKGSQVALARELQRAQEELKRVERLKAVGILAAGMAHEIKNPLTSIKTFTEYLPEKCNDPDFIDKFHKLIGMEVNKINDIVQQLLDFSKPKPLKLELSDIHQILEQTLSLFSNSLIKYKITLARNYAASLPSVSIDPNQMQQVFCNLFLNAIEAMKEGGKLTVSTAEVKLPGLKSGASSRAETTTVFIPGLKPGDFCEGLNNTIEITITDTGKGIAQKHLEHIFDPFYTTKEIGTGLGMSILYGIIKEHKGEIRIESEEGKGTRVIVKIPLP